MLQECHEDDVSRRLYHEKTKLVKDELTYKILMHISSLLDDSLVVWAVGSFPKLCNGVFNDHGPTGPRCCYLLWAW